jgi:transcriptional regulator with XRE-family HTH domain
MKLATYLSAQGMTQAQFADAIGSSQSDVARYVNGRIPRPEMMTKIISATGGEVEPNDFYDRGSIENTEAA